MPVDLAQKGVCETFVLGEPQFLEKELKPARDLFMLFLDRQ
jgi:hypothetical protein